MGGKFFVPFRVFMFSHMYVLTHNTLDILLQNIRSRCSCCWKRTDRFLQNVQRQKEKKA